jgi:cell wall assembly regulator SMI1
VRDLRELNINEMGRPVSRLAPTEADFIELEAALGRTLPDDYKSLLRVANGGHPELNSFVPEGAAPESRLSVDIFYYLSPDKAGPTSIWRALHEYSPVLKPHRLPIGRDEGGNQIVLDLDNSPPSVKMAIHDEDFREIPAAPSVDRFLGLLASDPDMI